MRPIQVFCCVGRHFQAFQLVYQTGLFVDDCKAWKCLPKQQKTWIGLKTFFAAAHKEWHKSQSTTTGAEFHSANLLQEEDTTQIYQQETVNAIANLATATASDRATVATLTATNRTLTSALTDCQLQLVEALQNVAKTHYLPSRSQQKSQRKAIHHRKFALLLDSWLFFEPL